MSALTNSIASRWSGVSVYGNASSNSPLPVGVGRERVALAALALGVQVQQLARQLLGGPPRARLERVPAGAAELGQRRVLAARADVAADLGELVDRHEHAVRARVLEVQVVARDARDGLGVEPGEARDPVVLVDDDVAGAQLGEAPQHAAAADPRPPVRSAAPAAEQPVLGDHREVELRRDEALLEPRLGQRDPPGGRRRARRAVAEPVDLEPAEVVGGPLALAAPGEGDDVR